MTWLWIRCEHLNLQIKYWMASNTYLLIVLLLLWLLSNCIRLEATLEALATMASKERRSWEVLPASPVPEIRGLVKEVRVKLMLVSMAWKLSPSKVDWSFFWDTIDMDINHLTEQIMIHIGWNIDPKQKENMNPPIHKKRRNSIKSDEPDHWTYFLQN